MTWESAEGIADALLYEGYLLYPYRGSAVKNQYRWQFGIVAPRGYSDAGGSEPWLMRTECLVEPGAEPLLDVKVRFLQVEARQVETVAETPDTWRPVDSAVVDGRELVSWDEAVAQALVVSSVRLNTATPAVHAFEVAGAPATAVIRDGAGGAVVRVSRRRWPISCTLHVAAEPIGALRKVSVTIENLTPWPPAAATDRQAALRSSLLGAHVLLGVRDGAFLSLLEPPLAAQSAVAACANLHTWPVLVGEPPRRDLMLSSPIILYDYPQVAPESPGDLFDSTEIDELLTLRLLTLTAEERRQAAATDPRAARLIGRAARLSVEQLERLHGAVRYLGQPTGQQRLHDPPGEAAPPRDAAQLEEWLNPPGSNDGVALDARGRNVTRGARVRLRPAGGADAMDMFLAEQTATVAGVYRDLEDRAHVAIRVDAAGEAELTGTYGRHLYFRPDEVEVIEAGGTPLGQARNRARLLVAGIGNIFLGDDGFGSAVVQKLAARALPDDVRVEDFGIRSIHLAYDLLGASHEATILIDAVARGGAPGTVYVLEPELDDAPRESPDSHGLGVEGVLALVKHAGGDPGRVIIVGCEPLSLEPGMGLSDVVIAAVDEAADLVVTLLAGVGG